MKTIKKTLSALAVITVMLTIILFCLANADTTSMLKSPQTVEAVAETAEMVADAGTQANIDTLSTIEKTTIKEEPSANPSVADGLPANTSVGEELPATPAEEVFREYDISLMAVGDNLMHMGVVRSGEQPDGNRDYTFLYQNISDFLKIADIKIINQETILAGNERGFSGFPAFNSPTEVGDAIAKSGFNVVLHASNHSADQGKDGLISCANFWSENYPDILVPGISADAETAGEIPLLSIGDITFAILNYTYGPNMEVLPKSLEGHLNILCNYNPDNYQLDFTTLNPQVITDIQEAEKLADVVIVCPHWGTEYTPNPSSYQKEFAQQMTQAGADVIIGTHPHVTQPIEWITSENGNRCLCYYSLGNYVSTQKGGLSMLEAMAWVTFHVSEEEVTISEETTGVVPLVCQYTSGPVRIENIYLLENYTADLAASHGIHAYGGVNLTLEDLQGWSHDILGDFVLPTDAILKNESAQ